MNHELRKGRYLIALCLGKIAGLPLLVIYMLYCFSKFDIRIELAGSLRQSLTALYPKLPPSAPRLLYSKLLSNLEDNVMKKALPEENIKEYEVKWQPKKGKLLMFMNISF